MNMAQMLTATDLAKAVGLSRNTVAGMIRRGEMKAVKAGRRYLISPAEASRFFNVDAADLLAALEDKKGA